MAAVSHSRWSTISSSSSSSLPILNTSCTKNSSNKKKKKKIMEGRGTDLGAASFLSIAFAALFIFSGAGVNCSPPEDPVRCSINGTTNCTITNSYGAFSDGTATCRAAAVFFPSTEEELVGAVAAAAKGSMSVKVATRYSHSIPKLSCPRSSASGGILISTRRLDRVVAVDAASATATVESGVTLEKLIGAAAAAGLAIPNSPYWWGLTVGGMLATGAHGSSLWGKGGAVHEYVVGIRIVTPASPEEGYAIVRSLTPGDPGFDSARVSLGVLGAISQVMLRLEPLFKRSVTYEERSDVDLAARAVAFGREHEFADMTWLPGHRKIVYRIDDRVPSNTSGDGRIDFLGFRPTPSVLLATTRLTEEALEAAGDSRGKCLDAKATTGLLALAGYGLENGGGGLVGRLFTGYPVVGSHHRLQSSGGCLDSTDNNLATACPWDPRVKGEFFFQTTVSIGLPKVDDFILDVQRLRDMDPSALCGVELYNGILMRFVKGSTVPLGKREDSLDFDITYYRSRGDNTAPRMNGDVMEEIEQMAVFKYGGLPHWGKNREVAFDGVAAKYGRKWVEEFLSVKEEFDPQGLFSSEWTDRMLGLSSGDEQKGEGCALEGLCVCSDDSHCSPARGYFCRPGKVYKEARVCSRG